MLRPSTSLGEFARLPFEVRELIWLEFTPSGEDTPFEKHRQKTDLSILCTSRYLNGEICHTIFSRTYLKIELSPVYKLDRKWMTVELYHHHYRLSTPPRKAKWVIKGPEDVRSRGLYNFLFHRIGSVVVDVCAPNPQDMSSLFTLWQKVDKLVKVFQETSKIEDLGIHLVKRDGLDWINKDLQANASLGRGYYDHDIVVVPLCGLRNVRKIHIGVHSEEVEKAIDWSVMSWAQNSSNLRIDDYEETFDDYMDRRMATTYYRLHKKLWMRTPGRAADELRLDLLRRWFVQGFSGVSEFEERMIKIITAYPETFGRVDPGLCFLESIHKTMVCMYQYAQVTGFAPNNEGPDYWDQRAWDRLFPVEVPASLSSESNVYKEFVDEDAYLWCLTKGGFLAQLGLFIMYQRTVFAKYS